jgi:hypothetical protein
LVIGKNGIIYPFISLHTEKQRKQERQEKGFSIVRCLVEQDADPAKEQVLTGVSAGSASCSTKAALTPSISLCVKIKQNLIPWYVKKQTGKSSAPLPVKSL